MKRIIFILSLLLIVFAGKAQQFTVKSNSSDRTVAPDFPRLSTVSVWSKHRAPNWSIKTNLLYDATTTVNLGAEFKIGKLYTLDIPVNFNNWTYSENSKFKNFVIQPELRRWVREPFNGHFIGVNLFVAYYNIGNINMPLGMFPKLRDYRYEGNLFGGGISYGYQWMLTNRLNLEATFGLGYAYINYKESECRTCGFILNENSKSYFGPTKFGLSLIYIVR